MKKRYLLTTVASPDGVVYTFTEKGFFEAVEILQTDMPLQNRDVLVKRIYVFEETFLNWAKTIDCLLVKLDDKITFDMFWNMYDDKARSSKKRSQKLWDKLKEEDRLKAYHYYHTYMKNKPAGVGKKYAETYLADELWNN